MRVTIYAGHSKINGRRTFFLDQTTARCRDTISAQTGEAQHTSSQWSIDQSSWRECMDNLLYSIGNIPATELEQDDPEVERWCLCCPTVMRWPAARLTPATITMRCRNRREAPAVALHARHAQRPDELPPLVSCAPLSLLLAHSHGIELHRRTTMTHGHDRRWFRSYEVGMRVGIYGHQGARARFAMERTTTMISQAATTARTTTRCNN
jgi:hypothetical protein